MVLELVEICGEDTELENLPEDEENGRQQSDPRPEFFQYKDEGCRHARSCLGCPFPQCRYDRRRRKRQTSRERRDGRIVKLFRRGKNVKELAEFFQVSQRTVHRIVGRKNSIRKRKNRNHRIRSTKRAG